jgi:hypothetical protein
MVVAGIFNGQFDVGDIISAASFLVAIMVLIRQRAAFSKATHAAVLADIVRKEIKANTELTLQAKNVTESNAQQLKPKNGITTAETIQSILDAQLDIVNTLNRHLKQVEMDRTYLNLPPIEEE